MRFKVNTPPVIHQTVDGEVIVVNLDNGTYYSIAGAGADIWGALDAGAGLPETVELVVARYDAEAAQVEGAVAGFVDELVAEGLISPAARNGVAVPPAAAAASGRFEEPVLHRYTDMQELLMLDPIHEVDETGWPHGLEPDPAAAEG
jgi:hypothetical protein